METKRCSMCKETKPQDEAHFQRLTRTHTAKSGVKMTKIYWQSRCRVCNSKAASDWVKAKRARLREQSRIHTQRYRAVKKNPTLKHWVAAVRKARKLGIPI